MMRSFAHKTLSKLFLISSWAFFQNRPGSKGPQIDATLFVCLVAFALLCLSESVFVHQLYDVHVHRACVCARVCV